MVYHRVLGLISMLFTTLCYLNNFRLLGTWVMSSPELCEGAELRKVWAKLFCLLRSFGGGSDLWEVVRPWICFWWQANGFFKFKPYYLSYPKP